MSRSNIEWTDDTPNPVVGCTKQSAGCENCYAIRMAWRLMHSDKQAVRKKYEGTVHKTACGKLNWTGRINIDHSAMARVIKQKTPKMYFVNSMGDMFHPSVPFSDIDIVFAAMAISPQHIFQILTKHPDRMLEWLNCVDEFNFDTIFRINQQIYLYWKKQITVVSGQLSNVWMGTSVENQKEADNRRDHLKAVADMGGMTWVSNEPALGHINWEGWQFIKWMVTGGESGPGARPMHTDWALEARDFCAQHKIPFFFKQWGAWAAYDQVDLTGDITEQFKNKYLCITRAGQTSKVANDLDWQDREENCVVYNFGKHISGRLLDGQLHDEYPKQ